MKVAKINTRFFAIYQDIYWYNNLSYTNDSI